MHQLVICATLCIAMATGSQNAVGDCTLKCTSANNDSLNVSVRQSKCSWPDGHPRVSDMHLDLNPYLVDEQSIVYTDCAESRELRWTPGLEATWRAPNNVTVYEVQFHDLPVRKLENPRAPMPPRKSTCFQVEVDNPHYKSCEYKCKNMPSPSVLVRILLNRSNSMSMDESTINFHRWFQSIDQYKGLSLVYQRPLMPQAIREEYVKLCPLPNPRHWATILKVYNNSDSGNVSVTFDLATNEVRVGKYQVTLYKYDTADYSDKNISDVQLDKINLTNVTTGSWTFYNVSTGTYFIRVKTWSNMGNPRGKCWTKDYLKDKLVPETDDTCFSDDWGNSDCLHVDSGLFTLTEPPNQLHHEYQASLGPFESPPSGNGLLVVVAGIGATMSIVVALSLLYLFKTRGCQPKDTIRNVIVIPPSPGGPDAQEDGDTSKSITVLLVYSRDNRAHIHVVNKFAQLLRQVGNCNVLLDMEDKAIARYTAIDWVDAQLKESDKVIFIKSEGALRRMQLANDKFYAKIETENLGPTFTASVRAMDVQSSRNRGNFMVVSFAYSNQKSLCEDKLLTIAGNNSQFQLMTELNSLLLAIRDLSQCQAGLFRTVYAGQGEELSSTQAYMELQKAIEEAVDYHHTKPDWFQYEPELRLKKPVDGSTTVGPILEEDEPELSSMFTGCTLPPRVQAMVAPSSQESLHQIHSDTSSSVYSAPVTQSEQLPCWTPSDDGEPFCDSGFRSISQTDLACSETRPSFVTYPYFSGSEHMTGMPDLYAPESVSSSYIEDLDKQEQELLPNAFHSSGGVPHHEKFPEHVERADLLVGQFCQEP